MAVLEEKVRESNRISALNYIEILLWNAVDRLKSKSNAAENPDHLTQEEEGMKEFYATS